MSTFADGAFYRVEGVDGVIRIVGAVELSATVLHYKAANLVDYLSIGLHIVFSLKRRHWTYGDW